MRESLSRKANAQNRRQTTALNPNLAYDDRAKYPELKRPRHAPGLNYWNQRSHTSQTPQTNPPNQNQTNIHHPRDTHQMRSNNQVHNHSNNYTNRQQVNQQETPNELFSHDELLQLTQDMVSSLRGCRNKEQQFNAIARLALKYLHGDCNV